MQQPRRLALAFLLASAAAIPAAMLLASAGASASLRPVTVVAHPNSLTAPRIVIRGFGFHGDLTVKRGEQVLVVNRDSVTHTLTSNTGRFDTGPVPANGGRRHFVAPRQVGTYRFHCSIHPEMRGTLHVVR